MSEIKQNDVGEYCLEGYGDADACYPTEDEAKAAAEKRLPEEDTADAEPMPDAATEDAPVDPEAEEAPADVATVDVPSGIRRLVLNIGTEVAKAFRRKDADEATGFKVVGNYFLCTWSNNFEDRDGEIFTSKAIDDYVARVDMGVVPPPELWVWHLPGTRIGQAEWVERHAHSVLAFGTFDDTPQGVKARDYYQQHTGKKSLSHGFTYPASQFDGRHYHSFNTFEISLLPRGAEANMYTSLEGVKAMMKVISEAKKSEVFAAFGEELGKRILEAEEVKGKALEGLVEYKDFVQPEGSKAATNAQALENADKAFKDLMPDLMEGSAEAVSAALEAVKVAKVTQAQYQDAMKQIDDLRAEMNLRPRAASKAAETAIDTTVGKGKELLAVVEKQMVERDGFWGTETVRTP